MGQDAGSSVVRVAPLFRKVVLVATGSGIGPCLPVIMAGNSTLVEFKREGDFANGPALSTERANRPTHVLADSTLSGVLSE